MIARMCRAPRHQAISPDNRVANPLANQRLLRHLVLPLVMPMTTAAIAQEADSVFEEESAIVGLNAPQSGEVDTKHLHKGMGKFAKQIRIYVDVAETRKAKLLKTAIFSWSNPERKTVAGNLFVWTLNGRPQASLGAWCVRGKGAKFEMQSFSDATLKVNLPGESWTPTAPGLKFTRLDTATRPADSPTRRAFQMRAILAKRFEQNLNYGTDQFLINCVYCQNRFTNTSKFRRASLTVQCFRSRWGQPLPPVKAYLDEKTCV